MVLIASLSVGREGVEGVKRLCKSVVYLYDMNYELNFKRLTQSGASLDERAAVLGF